MLSKLESQWMNLRDHCVILIGINDYDAMEESLIRELKKKEISFGVRRLFTRRFTSEKTVDRIQDVLLPYMEPEDWVVIVYCQNNELRGHMIIRDDNQSSIMRMNLRDHCVILIGINDYDAMEESLIRELKKKEISFGVRRLFTRRFTSEKTVDRIQDVLLPYMEPEDWVVIVYCQNNELHKRFFLGENSITE